MCFRGIFAMAIAIGLIALNGCGLNLGEKAPPQSPVAYKGGSYDCLSEIPQKVEDYVADKMSDDQITSYVRCIQDSFISFAQFTRGRDQDTYTPDEIRRFLQTYFLKGREISDALLHQFMVIKQDWIGGSATVISRSELYTAVQILDDIREQAILLKPHLKILNPALLSSTGDSNMGAEVQAANQTLNQAIDVLTKRLAGNQKTYAYQDLSVFMKEFRKFVGWEQHFPNAVPVDNWMALLKSFKQVTVSPDKINGIRGVDWAPLLQSMSHWYLAYIQYRAGVRHHELLQGVGLQNTNFLVEQVFELTRTALNRRQPSVNQVIRFDELHSLIQGLHDVHWLPANLRVSSIDETLKALVTRVFGDPNTPPDLRNTSGLTPRVLDRVEAQYHRWFYIQNRLNLEFPPETAEKSIPKLESTPPVSGEGVVPADQSLDSDWTEFLKVRSLMRPLFPDGSDRILLIGDSDLKDAGWHLNQGFHNLSYMNVLSSITSLIVNGYATQPASPWIWDSGLTSDELQKFYEDFRDIGIDLKIVDPRNTNTGHRGFIEGNLFTYASDGLEPGASGIQGQLSYAETMQFFGFLYSGGQSANDLYNDLAATCPTGPEDGVTGLKLIDKSCVRQNLASVLQKDMTNLPHLLAYLASLKKTGLQAYVQTIMDTALTVDIAPRPWIEHNELSTLAVVLYYSETVMTRFDKNGDGVLDNSEIRTAMPIFTGFIKTMAGGNLTDAEARGAFLYILINKAVPTGWYSKLWTWAYSWDLRGQLNLYWTKFDYDLNRSIDLDRSQLAQVFNVIIKGLEGQGTATEASPPVKPADTMP